MAVIKESALWVFQDLPGRDDLVEAWFQAHLDAIAGAVVDCKIKVYAGAGGDVMPKDIAHSVDMVHKQMHANYLLAMATFKELGPKWEKAYADKEEEIPPNLLPSIQRRLNEMLMCLHQLSTLNALVTTVFL